MYRASPILPESVVNHNHFTLQIQGKYGLQRKPSRSQVLRFSFRAPRVEVPPDLSLDKHCIFAIIGHD
jgi:hypothetical protein